jgi:beta-glucanase (GH16 family)
MLGSDISTAGWPHCGEIDIMEHVGYEKGNIHASIHTTDYNHTIGTQKTGQVMVPTATDSFHVYSLKWDSTYIHYLVDDDPYFFINNDSAGDKKKWPFNNPHYVILNLAIGGNWGGAKGIDNSVFPMEMEVDFVRVFKKKIMFLSMCPVESIYRLNRLVSYTRVGNFMVFSPLQYSALF